MFYLLIQAPGPHFPNEIRSFGKRSGSGAGPDAAAQAVPCDTLAPMNPRKAFRDLLRRPRLLVAPGCYDGLSARLVEAAGFEAAYLSGGAVARSMGLPDIGLVSLPEILDRVRQVTAAVRIPVIADADTGYGNAINLVRAVREFEQTGVAAIHLEDQVTPKRCGH